MGKEIDVLGSIDSIDHIVRNYGELLFDLCESILNSAVDSQYAFRSILKQIKAQSRFQKFSEYERSWVLRIACNRLLSLYQQNHEKQPDPRFEEDSESKAKSSEDKTNNPEFQAYFRRLSPEDRILLVLKDRYNIPYSEIAVALTTPEGSLKVRRQQALFTLEDWLWKSS